MNKATTDKLFEAIENARQALDLALSEMDVRSMMLPERERDVALSIRKRITDAIANNDVNTIMELQRELVTLQHGASGN